MNLDEYFDNQNDFSIPLTFKELNFSRRISRQTFTAAHRPYHNANRCKTLRLTDASRATNTQLKQLRYDKSACCLHGFGNRRADGINLFCISLPITISSTTFIIQLLGFIFIISKSFGFSCGLTEHRISAHRQALIRKQPCWTKNNRHENPKPSAVKRA